MDTKHVLGALFEKRIRNIQNLCSIYVPFNGCRKRKRKYGSSGFYGDDVPVLFIYSSDFSAVRVSASM